MIVAGFGFRTSASADSLRDAFARAVGDHEVDSLATLSDKVDSPAFQRLVAQLGLPVRAVGADDIRGVATATDSPHAQAARSAGSVAEATALVAAGAGSGLIGARVVSADRQATCALAEARIDGGMP